MKMDYTNILYFILLLIVSFIIRNILKIKQDFSPVSAPSIIMSVEIFTLASLPHLFFSNPIVIKTFIFEAIIIWLIIAGSYFKSCINSNLFLQLQNINNQFSVGTWVVSCQVVAVAIYKTLPSWHLLGLVFGSLALLLWIVYLMMIINNFRIILSHGHYSPNGLILLSTVSTQSIVILINTIFVDQISLLLNYLLISLGILFYIVSLYVLGRYYLLSHLPHISLAWKNTNCIIHGALSITGLACIRSSIMSTEVIFIIWCLASLLFIVVEFFDILAMLQRIEFKRFKDAIFCYDVSQWSRNFTYGMYYAFVNAIVTNNLFDNIIITSVYNYGYYIVFALLLIESALFLKSKWYK